MAKNYCENLKTIRQVNQKKILSSKESIKKASFSYGSGKSLNPIIPQIKSILKKPANINMVKMERRNLDFDKDVNRVIYFNDNITTTAIATPKIQVQFNFPCILLPPARQVVTLYKPLYAYINESFKINNPLFKDESGHSKLPNQPTDHNSPFICIKKTEGQIVLNVNANFEFDV